MSNEVIYPEQNAEQNQPVEEPANGGFQGAMVLTEEVNMKALRVMTDNFPTVYERMKGEGFGKFNRESGEWEDAEDEKTAYTILKELLDVKRKTKDVKYAYSARMKSGRRFATNSLQGISRRIRHTIAKGIYYDLDMANAHPTFLLELCRTFQFNHRILENYITKRDEVLNGWIGSTTIQWVREPKEKRVKGEKVKRVKTNVVLDTKDKAKSYFLSLVNGGGNDESSNAELNEFYLRHQVFLAQFFAHKDYTRFAHRARNKAREKKEKFGDKAFINLFGTAINLYLCEVEDKALTVIEEYLVKNNIRYGTLCFDGILVYIRDVPNLPHLMTALEKTLKEKMGFSILIKHKEMDEDIHIADLNTQDAEEAEPRVALHDEQAGEMLYAELKDTLKYSKGMFYRKVGHVWIYDEGEITRNLRKYVMSSNIWKRNAKGELVAYTQKMSHAQDIVKAIMDSACDEKNDDWEKNIFESSRGKLLFRNGYYDFQRGEFISFSSGIADESIVFTEEIPYHYNEALLDESYQQNIRERLFVSPFGEEMGDFFLLKLARAVAGDREKKFLVGIGVSNGGKSLLGNVLNHSIGGYYGAWNGANICYKNSSQDEAQKLRWTLLLRSKRIIVSSELTMTSAGIDGNILKKLSNGGHDDLTGRLHGKNETSFKLGFLPILFAQDLPKITPMDDAVKDRLRAIVYTKSFVDEPEAGNPFHLKKDRGLDAEIQTDRFRMNFVSLLFSTYKTWLEGGCSTYEPPCVKESVKEVVNDDGDLWEMFPKDFEVTQKHEDIVTSKEIQDWLEEKRMRMSMKKFASELKRQCVIKGWQNIVSDEKKINKKNTSIWRGIKRIKEEEEKEAQPVAGGMNIRLG